MLEATSRCGSRVLFSATTAKTTSPGERYFNPCARGITLQFGGKMDETRTRFWAAMPASRSASSNDVSRSLCFPTPLVRNMRLGTISLDNFGVSSILSARNDLGFGRISDSDIAKVIENCIARNAIGENFL